MATIANWNGHTFVVSSGLIRGFTDMSVKGGCESTVKNSDKQKYVERKYGEIPQITMTVGLNAQTGVTDVMGEAMEFIREATEGACAYFYLGMSKLIPAKMMLTDAEVVEIALMPGQGDRWISCDVKLTFRQGTKNDGSTGGSSGGGSAKQSVKTTTASVTKTDPIVESVTAAINTSKKVVETAKQASKTSTAQKVSSASVNAAGSGLAYINSLIKSVTTTSNSSTRTSATTGRSGGGDPTVRIVALK